MADTTVIKEIFGIISELVGDPRFKNLIFDHKLSIIKDEKLYWNYEGSDLAPFVVFDPITQQVHQVKSWHDELNEDTLLSFDNPSQLMMINIVTRQIRDYILSISPTAFKFIGIIIEIPD